MREAVLQTSYLDYKEKLAWMRLIRCENVGPIHFFHLIKRFKNAYSALKNLPKITLRAGRHTPLIIPSQDIIEREFEACKKRGIHILAFPEPNYPNVLRSLSDAPPLLNVMGHLELFEREMFAIVGSRNASTLGQKVAHEFSQELGASGCVIVSGLAEGIDTIAHKASLKTGTIAVVAQGIDRIYPPKNKELHEAIQKEGLMISEAPLSMSAQGCLFPRRNRLISGLSWGVLVVEAALKSGSLITARYAGEQGREVFAIPGHPKDPRANGTNKLIKEGAQLVETPEDILNARPMHGTETIQVQEETVYDITLDDDEIEKVCQDIKRLLSPVFVPLESLRTNLQVPAHLMQAALVELEISGLVEVDHKGYVCRVMEAA